jgi:hypothetical protein
MKTITTARALAFVMAGSASAVGAGEIVGGSALLDKGSHAQLERWLGAGQFNLNNIYTRKTGDTSLDFHHAADGKGANFVLLELTNNSGASFLVGGYDPQSWSSTDGWHNTPYDYQRTAFLFNMTEPAVYRQVPATYVLPSQGLRQTFNAIDYGPTFGAGHDLFVNRTLDVGFSWQLTYGDPADAGRSIVDRSTGAQIVRVDALEIFALAPVPEPGSWAMLLGGLGLLTATARRRPA